MSTILRARERPEPATAGVLESALGAALLFSAARLPPPLSALAVAAPLPLVVHRLKRGLPSALMASGFASALLLWVFPTSVPGLLFLGGLALPGLVMAEAMARGRGLRRGCHWAFLVVTAETLIALLVAGPDIGALFAGRLEALRLWPDLRDVFKTAGDDLDSTVARLRAVLAVVYPAVCLILGGLSVLANGFLLRTYLAREDPGWLEGGEFEGTRWPLALPVAFVAAAPAVLLKPLSAAAYNVLLLVGFFAGIQGLAVVSYYAHRLAGPAFLRTTILFIVVADLVRTPWASVAIALLGLFDVFFDFRRFADPPDPGEGG